MASIKIPTPLRVYTSNTAEVLVEGTTVGEALNHLVEQYPDLKTHLFQDEKLRNFVNVFLGDEDIRFLDGTNTSIGADAKLRIIPSIAGGTDVPLRKVDRIGFKFGNGSTIVLLLIAFVLNLPLLVLFVALAQLAGALNLSFAPYRVVYQLLVKQGLLKPDVITDNPEPHRFAMLVGALFNGVGGTLLVAGSGSGWIPVWIVIALANLNFWLEFCAGCWMYYQFNRLGVPGFTYAPVKDA